MLNGKKTIVGILLIVCGLIAGLIIASNFNIQNQSLAQIKQVKEVSPQSKDFLIQLSSALADVSDVVKPSVVNISTQKTVDTKDNPMGRFFDDPMFKRFFGDESPFHMPKKQESRALGSGVIIKEDGYIVTNSHVVKDMDEIKVILADKTEYKGKIIGTDPKTDVAVIKIDAHDLPVIKMGDSSKMKVGEIVLAVGNPFGLNQTVTMGIVSAVGRSEVGIADYEDFIQIDAPINPGNSGGALVNASGELAGINTAIFSTSGGYQGIGFAIPSSMVKNVMDKLIKSGKVIRGWLGVNIQPLTPELSKSFGLKEKDGVLIADVVEGGPAEKAGLKRGDLIISFDSKDASNTRQLRNLVANTLPGATLDLKAVRDGKEMSFKVTVGELPDAKQAAAGGAPSSSEFLNRLKGVGVQDITASIRERFNYPAKVSGVIVTNVADDSSAFNVLKQGDVIQEVNRKRINNVKEYDSIVSKIKAEEDILLLVYRGTAYIYVTITGKK
ncbi:DegQ family serine endoprotease [Candidatus Magnetominusculus xianensis]|uniref:Serine protease n=1 Tax=Candidatus Magnetominusculus xianensis TaxID=1748249 RepID=A0ABR5SEC8_9BACT|nr:DegQ family serine endoprotease [Candidatus Magnetominusculus xianensis]KWT84141.1 putative serine protease [Candidatus Magnetominusculus xianensis]MBF0402433.1 DegQ family serine endoprotease [Nitrospirota bacterium]